MMTPRVLLCLLIMNLGLFNATARGQSHQILQAAYASPNLDGNVDAVWQTTQTAKSSKIVKPETKLDFAEVATGEFRCLWDDEYLYVLADIQDPQLSTKSGNAWEQDSIEIFLDENMDRSPGYQPDDSQYRISANGTISTGGYASGKNIKAIAKKTDDGYRIEAAIKLNTAATRSRTALGIEFQVNNDDGSAKRVSVTKWNHDKNEAWRDTSNFGTVQLVKCLGTAQPTAKHSTIAAAVPKQASREKASQRVPQWAADAVFYQIFPERFRNGDPSNDPTCDSLEFPDIIPPNWRPTPWTAQWYERDEWEKSLGDNFYENGVFHRRYGGDLQGVIDKLDYLQDLGINTIYFNPVFYARSLHKYDGNSFHHVDPHFGPDPAGDFATMKTETADPSTWKWTAADKLFLELLKQAHQKSIRVIIDGVFNHTGRDFFAFQDIVKNQAKSSYLDWYMVESFDDPATATSEFKYKGWWGVETLPEFANNAADDDLHPSPKAYVMKATRRWMDPNGDGNPEDGIDGWRLDVANEVPNKFWQDWNRMVREVNPQAYTVAEIWDNAGNYLKDCGFSATMNYHGFAFPVKGFLIDGRLPASQFGAMLEHRMNEHDRTVQFALQNLVDSHDTDRLASMIVNARRISTYQNADRFDYDVGQRVSPRWDKKYDVTRPNSTDQQILKLVAMFQMTFVGAPMIYYGTEAGMDGGDDPDDRMPMVWDDLQYESRDAGPFGKLQQSSAIRFDKNLFRYYRELIEARKAVGALRRGSFRLVHTDDDNKLLGFIREFEGERVLVVLNRGSKRCRLHAKDLKLTPADQLNPVFRTWQSDSVARYRGAIDVPALQGGIWKIEKIKGHHECP